MIIGLNLTRKKPENASEVPLKASKDGVQGPELHDLHSVSALLATQGLGALSRLLLRHRPAVGLEGLRRVRTLGQGTSGTVIEVEYDVQGSRSSLRLRAAEEPRRFAMKLQSKRPLGERHEPRFSRI